MNTHSIFRCAIFLSIALNSVLMAQAQEISLERDNQVLEKLSPRLPRASNTAPEQQLLAIRQAITLARQHADPRYLGQAQALIGTSWANPHASHELLTLQATIEQSRHEFDAARKTLQLALSKPATSKAQAQLTLASVERVQGQYSEAVKVCNSIQEPSTQLYAKACTLETLSLQGQWPAASEGFSQLLKQTSDRTQQAWLYSLLAEHEERMGHADAALQQFSRSLALATDGYTALAYADALLAQHKAAQALAVLQGQAESDAVLIRRAQAYLMTDDAKLTALMREIEQRFAAAAQRGESLAHAREQALYALRVKRQATVALKWAQLNLQLQREPIDWLLAVQSAQLADQTSEKTKLLSTAAQTGLKDARLQ